MGSDLLPGIRSWHEGDQLVSHFHFLIFVRTGYALEDKLLPTNYILIRTTFVAASSSEARKRIISNWKKLLVRKNSLDNLSEEEGSSFPKIKHLPPSIITCSDKINLKRSATLKPIKDLREKYLGVYGILPFSIIDYIKVNNLYITTT